MIATAVAMKATTQPLRSLEGPSLQHHDRQDQHHDRDPNGHPSSIRTLLASTQLHRLVAAVQDDGW